MRATKSYTFFFCNMLDDHVYSFILYIRKTRTSFIHIHLCIYLIKFVFLPTNGCKSPMPPVAYIQAQCVQIPAPNKL